MSDLSIEDAIMPMANDKYVRIVVVAKHGSDDAI